MEALLLAASCSSPLLPLCTAGANFLKLRLAQATFPPKLFSRSPWRQCKPFPYHTEANLLTSSAPSLPPKIAVPVPRLLSLTFSPLQQSLAITESPWWLSAATGLQPCPSCCLKHFLPGWSWKHEDMQAWHLHPRRSWCRRTVVTNTGTWFSMGASMHFSLFLEHGLYQGRIPVFFISAFSVVNRNCFF